MNSATHIESWIPVVKRLMHVTEELCAKAHMSSDKLHILIHDSPLANAWASYYKKGSVAGVNVTTALLKLFGDTPRAAGISDTTATILAHELYHVKDIPRRFKELTLGHQKLILYPIAGMAAAGLLEQSFAKAKSRNPDPTPQEIAEGIEEITAQNPKLIEVGSWGSGKPLLQINLTEEHLRNAAKYLAIGALGAGAAILEGRHLSHINEFNADRFYVELTRKPQALIDGLRQLTAASGNIEAEVLRKIPLPKKLKMIWEELAFHSHPPLAERIANIRAVAHENGLGHLLEREARVPPVLVPQPSYAAALTDARLLAEGVKPQL